ncbi:MAG: T9SS type A sorting domain-containing protein [Saprospiraceae bacterium]|nr:T9SS type A sorting domain-containing protein [Saprospiraceae bacterium]
MKKYSISAAMVCTYLALHFSMQAQSIEEKRPANLVQHTPQVIGPITLNEIPGRHPSQVRSFSKSNYSSISGRALSKDHVFMVQRKSLHVPPRSVYATGLLIDASKARSVSKNRLHLAFLEESLDDPLREGWEMQKEQHFLEIEHSRFQQFYQEVPIWCNELTVHQQDLHFSITGIAKQAEMPQSMVPVLSVEEASYVVTADLRRQGIHLMAEEQRQQLQDLFEADKKELVLYPSEDVFTLAYHITSHPNPASRFEYFVDAHTGTIINQYESLCKFHHHAPPAARSLYFNEQSEGTGFDLNAQNRRIQTWFYQGTHYLVDATKTSMFNAVTSTMPGRPVGAIITLDAINTFPGKDNFRVRDLVSQTTDWNNPNAVSAHTNASVAFDYFEQKFGRISLNGQGGNIISVVNVVDEDGLDMDNAFWNGKAMFFGNGNEAFSAPLAKALDVTVHELSHGVIETTANLNYQGESGALNESFADVFAVQVDREDWLIGEDVVNTNIFRSGGLRNMANPNNGGSRVGDRGYQPDHYSQFFNVPDSIDNGGVHINSGIPNRAFFLFASEVGDDVAEQVYYDVLVNYLTRSSQFIDLRLAVIAASTMRYGSEVADAARAAFDGVGIIGEEGGNYFEEEAPNPGNDLIFIADEDRTSLALIDPAGNVLLDPVADEGLIKPPSVTDDGSLMVYVAADGTIRFGQFDWSVSPATFSSGTLQSSPIWYNVAISRDGLKLAAVPLERTDSIFVFDLEMGTSKIFELYNPTTSQVNINTDEVLFADAIEWDHFGEFLMYDAFNRITNTGSIESIEYWDIGFMKVWDDDTDTFGDGTITKLFSGLPEKISVGNPTFAENAPYILAFDLIDETNVETDYEIRGVNIETGELGLLYDNTVLSYPSFSRMDDKIIFDAEAESTFSTVDVIGQIGVASDKINGTGEATVLKQEARWGVWFSNGDRDLSTPTFEDDGLSEQIQVYPNPVADVLNIYTSQVQRKRDYQVEIHGLDGKVLKSVRWQRHSDQFNLPVQYLPAGLYFLHIGHGNGHHVLKICKS